MAQNNMVMNYRPSEDEPFMNPRQLEYFKSRLNTWREQILKETEETLHSLQETSTQEPDILDSAALEEARINQFRTRDRERKLLKKIEDALKRIDDGSYGYCEETGEPISLKRLEARPIASLSVEAQEMHEKKEKLQR